MNLEQIKAIFEQHGGIVTDKEIIDHRLSTK